VRWLTWRFNRGSFPSLEQPRIAKISRRRRWPLALLLALPLLAMLAGLMLWQRGPESVAQTQLVGARAPTPLRIVLLLDESGSFTDYQALRNRALTQVLSWAPDNLRPDDSIAVISFAGGAELRLPLTLVADLSSTTPSLLPSTPSDGTNIQPPLALAASLDGNQPTALIAVTDTEVFDSDPSAIEALARQLNVTTMSVILPVGESVHADWHRSFPYGNVIIAKADSAESTSLAIGEATAHATSQQLVTVR
jgi:hypothetical protein